MKRAHFKLDWHKYNVKQMLMQNDYVKEEVFEEIISGIYIFTYLYSFIRCLLWVIVLGPHYIQVWANIV